jgi:TonB family protein
MVVSVFNKITSEPVMNITVIPSYSEDTIAIDAPGIFVIDKHYETKQLDIIKEGYNTGMCLLYKIETLEDSMTIYLMPTPENTNPIFVNSWHTKMNQLKEKYSMSENSREESATKTEEIIKYPDIEAEFPGGKTEVRKFLTNHLKYPDEALINEEMGKVFVSFIVETDGTLTNINIIRGVSDSLDAESIRIIKIMPKWIPAICDGVFVRSEQRLPFQFSCCH